jgi:DNA-binding transcriptional LysR family regulator
MKLAETNSEILAGGNHGEGLPARNLRMYDSRRMRISLKQWRMLHAVIDCNGFSAAAEYLHVSQSVISYTLAKMQEQLGIPLLKIEGRKAHVTEQGRALMEYSRNVINSAIELEAIAEKMRMGWEPELRLMVDHDCPHAFVMDAVRSFSTSTAHVKVSLLEGSGAQVEQAIMQNTVDLAICANVPPGLIADRLMSTDYVAVAHPSHPLAQAEGVLTENELGRHTRVVLGSGASAKLEAGASRKGDNSAYWHVSSMDTALAALEAGLGYAWLPLNRVRQKLQQGSLQLLSMPAHYHNRKDFYLVHARQASPGVAASSLSSLLHSHVALSGEAVTRGPDRQTRNFTDATEAATLLAPPSLEPDSQHDQRHCRNKVIG